MIFWRLGKSKTAHAVAECGLECSLSCELVQLILDEIRHSASVRHRRVPQPIAFFKMPTASDKDGRIAYNSVADVGVEILCHGFAAQY